MRKLLAFGLVGVLAASVSAEAPGDATTEGLRKTLWAKLEARIQAIDDRLDAVMGVAIVDLTSGESLYRNADLVYPTASSIKLAVLAELYRQSERGGTGNAALQDPYVVDARDLVPDSYIMAGLTPGSSRVTNRDLATFMLVVSDNSATNVLIDRVGSDRVNSLLDELGFHHVRLRRKMMDLKAASEGRENVGTPREMAGLLEAVYQGKVLGKVATDDFFKQLAIHKESDLPRLLPEDVRVANKPGSLEGVRNDTGVVFAQGRPFVISVMTTLAGDERAAEEAIAQIGRAAWECFDRIGRASAYGRVISPRNGH